MYTQSKFSLCFKNSSWTWTIMRSIVSKWKAFLRKNVKFKEWKLFSHFMLSGEFFSVCFCMHSSVATLRLQLNLSKISIFVALLFLCAFCRFKSFLNFLCIATFSFNNVRYCFYHCALWKNYFYWNFYCYVFHWIFFYKNLNFFYLKII